MPQSQKYDAVKSSRKEILVNNFLGGVAWAIGTTFGLSVVVALVSLLLTQIEVIPIVGEFVLQVSEFISEQSR